MTEYTHSSAEWVVTNILKIEASPARRNEFMDSLLLQQLLAYIENLQENQVDQTLGFLWYWLHPEADTSNTDPSFDSATILEKLETSRLFLIGLQKLWKTEDRTPITQEIEEFEQDKATVEALITDFLRLKPDNFKDQSSLL